MQMAQPVEVDAVWLCLDVLQVVVENLFSCLLLLSVFPAQDSLYLALCLGSGGESYPLLGHLLAL